MRPEPRSELSSILHRVVMRMHVAQVMRAASTGLLGAAVAMVLSRICDVSTTATAVIVLIIGGAAAVTRYARVRATSTAATAARLFERSDPSLHNVVVTAQELEAFPERATGYMREQVIAEASRRAGALHPARVLPLQRDVWHVAAAAAALAVVLLGDAAPPPARARSGQSAAPRPLPVSAGEFFIDLTAPAYTGRAAIQLRNPSAVEAIAGTEALIRLPPAAASVVRLNGTDLVVDPGGTVRAVLNQSGYLAIDAGPIHRLVPLSVTPDGAPQVRIAAPGKDMRVATTDVTIPIVAEATDDLALQSLELRYTIVSGTGEQFSFTEGYLPAALVRTSDRSWHVEAALSPSRLKLEAGDALIYRAVAADRRAGNAGVASSDTFFVEIAGPGDIALAGVEMPPDRERYTLSEAMIVLKIERLQARERGMAPPALVEAAGAIAAEQRAVRANFIFLLGGEIEDETVEAETSSEIAEGRFANQARQEIVKATVLMGRVEHALTAVSTRDALPLAREAVRALQRAFGHSRYLLRALPSRARIDPARRGSGDLAGAADWQRILTPATADPDAAAAREALMDLLAIARQVEVASVRADVTNRLSRLAEQILSLGSAGDLPAAAREVLTARDALTAGQMATVRAALQRASAPLVSRAQHGRINARSVSRDPARLAGAAAVAPGGGG
ncbi:MAG: hypothetical protein ABIQ52_07985 [Vicinamibacterales bacterium]